MAHEHPEETPDAAEAAPPEQEELPELDYADPLKRDPEREQMPGLDPMPDPVPPEDRAALRFNG